MAIFHSYNVLAAEAELIELGYGEAPYTLYVEGGKEREAQQACAAVANATYHVNETGCRDYIRISR